jgi:hypothetical protein
LTVSDRPPASHYPAYLAPITTCSSIVVGDTIASSEYDVTCPECLAKFASYKLRTLGFSRGDDHEDIGMNSSLVLKDTSRGQIGDAE